MAESSALQPLLAKPRVRVRVRPGARKTQITKATADRLSIDIAAPAQDGKANQELERYLTRLSGRPASVVAGTTDRDKTVRLG